MDVSPGRRERKRLQTAEYLADTAFGLFESQGYENVTMEQIAAACDVAKGTLYNHFPVKEALLQHYFHRQITQHAPEVAARLAKVADPVERISMVLEHSAAWGEQHRRYWPYYLHFRLGMPLDDARNERSGLDQLFTRLIADAQQAGRLRSDRDTAQLVHYFRFLFLGALTRWLASDNGTLLDEYRIMFDFFLAGAGKGAA